MKNFKKIIILCLIFTGVIVYTIYKTVSNNRYEEVEYENLYINQQSETDIETENFIIIHVDGEVKAPGIVKIEEGGRVCDAIEKAGGLTENANVNKLNLAFTLSDGQKLYIPSIYDEENKEIITEDAGENVIFEYSLKQNNMVNINTATQTELETLTGIGPSTALKIINYRKENGKFKNIEEIKNVPGIGEAKFEAIKNEICV